MERIDGREAELESPRPDGARARRPEARGGQARMDSAAFIRPTPDRPLLGHRPGVSRKRLRALESGAIGYDRRVDLHGLRRDAARAHLQREIANARSQDEECVLVVHGRGQRSQGGEAVLRNALSEWLDEQFFRGAVLAFAPARPGQGGEGATLLLLRRRSS